MKQIHQQAAIQTHTVTQELEQIMRMRRAQGQTCAQIAAQMGFSKSTVSLHTRAKDTPVRRRQPIKIPVFRRHDAHYEIMVYDVYRKPHLYFCAAFDHRPCYWDMMRLFRAHGLCAVDFSDDPGTQPHDRVWHGKAYLARTQMYPLARFTIRRVRGEVSAEDFFH